MPSIKNKKEERLWEKAKELAEEAGHKENYPYIMGIFKKMNPKRFSPKKLSFHIYKLAKQIETDYYKKKFKKPVDYIRSPYKGLEILQD